MQCGWTRESLDWTATARTSSNCLRTPPGTQRVRLAACQSKSAWGRNTCATSTTRRTMTTRNDKRKAAQEHNELEERVTALFDDDSLVSDPTPEVKLVIEKQYLSQLENTVYLLRSQFAAAQAVGDENEKKQLREQAGKLLKRIDAVKARIAELEAQSLEEDPDAESQEEQE